MMEWKAMLWGKVYMVVQAANIVDACEMIAGFLEAEGFRVLESFVKVNPEVGYVHAEGFRVVEIEWTF